jgi:hypothetical protein
MAHIIFEQAELLLQKSEFTILPRVLKAFLNELADLLRRFPLTTTRPRRIDQKNN